MFYSIKDAFIIRLSGKRKNHVHVSMDVCLRKWVFEKNWDNLLCVATADQAGKRTDNVYTSVQTNSGKLFD